MVFFKFRLNMIKFIMNITYTIKLMAVLMMRLTYVFFNELIGINNPIIF